MSICIDYRRGQRAEHPEGRQQLRDAGFTVRRTTGRHTIWAHPSGVTVPVPDSHRTITPGVYRSILAAMHQAEQEGEES